MTKTLAPIEMASFFVAAERSGAVTKIKWIAGKSYLLGWRV